MTSPLPRLGFLGTGWIGRHRIDSLHLSGEAVVVSPTEEFLNFPSAVQSQGALS